MKTLEEAVAARDEFLEQHPHLKPFQQKLDREFKDLPTEERLERLSNMMNGNLVTLGAVLKELPI
jgi:hypothetical protein